MNPASSGGILNWSLNIDFIFLVGQTISSHFRLGITVYSNGLSAVEAGFALGKSDTWSPGTCFSSGQVSWYRNRCRANELTLFYLTQIHQHIFFWRLPGDSWLSGYLAFSRPLSPRLSRQNCQRAGRSPDIDLGLAQADSLGLPLLFPEMHADLLDAH